MKVTNWLGQDIEVGSYVYRGAREGNTSTFKIGIVSKIDPVKNSVRVAWHVESPWSDQTDVYMSGNHFVLPFPRYRQLTTSGTPSIDSLVVISGEAYAYAMAKLQASSITVTAFKEGAVSLEDSRIYHHLEVEKWFRYYLGDDYVN